MEAPKQLNRWKKLTVGFAILAILFLAGTIWLGLLYNQDQNRIQKLNDQIDSLQNAAQSLDSLLSSLIAKEASPITETSTTTLTITTTLTTNPAGGGTSTAQVQASATSCSYAATIETCNVVLTNSGNANTDTTGSCSLTYGGKIYSSTVDGGGIVAADGSLNITCSNQAGSPAAGAGVQITGVIYLSNGRNPPFSVTASS